VTDDASGNQDSRHFIGIVTASASTNHDHTCCFDCGFGCRELFPFVKGLRFFRKRKERFIALVVGDSRSLRRRSPRIPALPRRNIAELGLRLRGMGECESVRQASQVIKRSHASWQEHRLPASLHTAGLHAAPSHPTGWPGADISHRRKMPPTIHPEYLSP